MRFDWWTFGLQTVNFAILVWLLRRFLYRPVLRMIDAREAELRTRRDAITQAEERAKARLAEIETARAGIAAERDETLRAAAAQAEAASGAMRERGKVEAEAWQDDARRRLATERDHALDEARQSALALGGAFARRLLAELPPRLRVEAWIEPVERHLLALPAEERAALTRSALTQSAQAGNAQAGSGANVRVFTAAPLPPGSAEAWRASLQRILGGGVSVTFDADPDLVAGAELHFPDAILRFSWRSLMTTMRSEIDPHADAR